MNQATNGAGKLYAWNGGIWGLAIAAGEDRDEDRAVETTTGYAIPLADLMRAHFAGEAREIPAAPMTPAPVSSVALAAPAAPSSGDVEAGEMDHGGKARAEEKIARARAAGIHVPATRQDGLFFDAGTAVMPEAWASERQAFDALPTGETQIPRVRDAIRAEDRENVTVPAWDLRLSARTGKLGHKPSETGQTDPRMVWEPGKRALQGWYQRAGIGTIPEHWPTHVRAQAANALCVDFEKTRPAASLVNGQDPLVTVRVQRAARGGPRAFAVVSPSYAPFDGDLVLDALLHALPRGARVGVDYDPSTARGRVEIITLQEERPVVGEPFRTSFTVGWDDTGGGSVWGDGGLFSVRCLNLTRIYTSAGSFSLRHAGSVGKLARRFRQEFDKIARALHAFTDDYSRAASEELTNKERRDSAELLQGIYRSLLQRDLVPVKGRREDAVKELAIQAMSDENHAGLTRAGVANGITRYAHRVNQDPWMRDELETAAGRIISSRGPAATLDYLARETAA